VDYVIAFSDWLQQHPQISGLVFLLVFALILAIGVPGGNIMMLASGMLFGAVMGAVLSVLGGVLAAWTTHLLIRTAFGRWLDRRAGAARARVRSFVDSGNWLLLVVPRLVPVIPFFVINVGLSAAGVPRRSYLLSTFIGLAPIAALFAHIGSRVSAAHELSELDAAALLASAEMLIPLAALIAITLLGWLLFRARGSA
jgi:uncharacterized membrane protein YdjX (TVP38/TMEM64 family)